MRISAKSPILEPPLQYQHDKPGKKAGLFSLCSWCLGGEFFHHRKQRRTMIYQTDAMRHVGPRDISE
jgi:hypothetical protein